ncbi:MAG: amidophosphoribosyltransferase [Clostridia bacterium]|nr:amidophosphoribosyltransferase [Clostridia bacterium]
MGGFFGIVSKQQCNYDLYYGVDYHSHLGTRRGGMAMYDREIGFQRQIHNIENSPFRTKFEKDVDEMRGCIGIACISDFEPQPLLVRSHLGSFALCTVGKINNEDALAELVLNKNHHYLELSGGKINPTELVASLINEENTIAEGIRFAQRMIDGSMSMLVLTKDCLYAARDFYGRLPVLIGKNDDGYAVSIESFAYEKAGFDHYRDLGPGEIVRITAEGIEQMQAPERKKRICSFLWTYYGYPNSHYEGVTVETMRYKCGEILADYDMQEGIARTVDYVAGVPDSGTPNAIGYANRTGIPFARPFIKYTPTWARSFMPTSQKQRNLVANKKQIPIKNLIEGKKLLFIDDSIVRGTQLRETVDFLYRNGAKEVHIRSACPPIMFGCKYLNFSRSKNELELITRRKVLELEGEKGMMYLDQYGDFSTDRGKAMVKAIEEEMKFSSLRFQSLWGVTSSIGLDPEDLCTYCWSGKE